MFVLWFYSFKTHILGTAVRWTRAKRDKNGTAGAPAGYSCREAAVCATAICLCRESERKAPASGSRAVLDRCVATGYPEGCHQTWRKQPLIDDFTLFNAHLWFSIAMFDYSRVVIHMMKSYFHYMWFSIAYYTGLLTPKHIDDIWWRFAVTFLFDHSDHFGMRMFLYVPINPLDMQ